MGDWVRYKLDQADRPYPGRRGAGHQRARNGTSSARWPANFSPGRARRGGTAHDLHRRRLQAGDLRLPGHRPGRASTSPAPGSRARREAIEQRLPRPVDGPELPLVAADPRGRRPGDRRPRPRRARPAAAAQPAREPSCRARRARSRSWLPVHGRERRRGGSGRGRLDQRRDPALCGAGSRGRSAPGSTSRSCSKARERPLRPEDILILVRRRGELAALIVARLHAEGVPVAGVDRLLLSAPLAVQDLLAAARFAAQPLDDLNLASLLVSPLFGWSQDELFDAALRPRRRRSGRTSAARGAARALAGSSDPRHGRLSRRRTRSSRRSSPARSTAGASCSSGSAPRRAIRSRNCSSSALEFESNAAASLQPFLDWFARGDVEIVRDPSAPLDAVRVMTVHGAKGLQSPVADPRRRLRRSGQCRARRRRSPSSGSEDGAPIVPVFRPRKDELAEPLKSQIERAGPARPRGALAAALRRADPGRGAALYRRRARRARPQRAGRGELVSGGRDGAGRARQRMGAMRRSGAREMRFGALEMPAKESAPKATETRSSSSRLAAPAGAGRGAPAAAARAVVAGRGRCRRSAARAGACAQAALRGRLLHALFERLPGVRAGASARPLAERWLERVGRDRRRGAARGAGRRRLPGHRRSRASPTCSAPEALAEAPIAAVVGGRRGRLGHGRPAAGRATTAFSSPTSRPGAAPRRALADIPAAHLRQMAAYRAALRVIFPGRPVEAALLYTAAPVLHRAARRPARRAHAPRGG